MEIITSLEAVKTEYSPSVIALGTFDGLHLGHQDIIKTARDYAQKHGLKLIVFTFSNHPLSLIKPDLVPVRIITQQQKIKYLEKLGVDILVNVPFDHDLAGLSPDEFLKKYGAQRFEVLLDACQNQAEYRLDSLKRKYDLTLDDQRVEFLNQAAALIATFPNAVQREVYGRRAAEAAGITPEAMQLEIKKAYRKARAIEQKKQEAQELDIARQRAPKTRAIRYDNLRSATAEEGLICTLLREPELIANVKLPAEAFSVDLFGRVLADLRQRVQSGRPVSLAALGPDLTPEEMAHLSYVMSRDTAPVSDEAFADYLRVIQEEYEGRSLTRSEENLRLLAEQMKSTKQYGG